MSLAVQKLLTIQNQQALKLTNGTDVSKVSSRVVTFCYKCFISKLPARRRVVQCVPGTAEQINIIRRKIFCHPVGYPKT